MQMRMAELPITEPIVRIARAVGERRYTPKIGDVRAGHAPESLMDPTDPTMRFPVENSLG